MAAILDFRIGTILAIFDLQVARYFLPSFESVGFLIQEKTYKIGFKMGKRFYNLPGGVGGVVIKSKLLTTHDGH